MSTEIQKHIEETNAAWEGGELGASEDHVAIEDLNLENAINDALSLQAISVRLQRSLIDDLKLIAKLNGIGYQPLMRQILTRFVECEKKKYLREAIDQAKVNETVAEQPEPRWKTA